MWAWVLVMVLVSARWLAYLLDVEYLQFHVGTELCQEIRLLVERNKFLNLSIKPKTWPVGSPTRFLSREGAPQRAFPKCTYVEESPTMSCRREGATPSSPSAGSFFFVPGIPDGLFLRPLPLCKRSPGTAHVSMCLHPDY